jgi:DNA repair protein RadC
MSNLRDSDGQIYTPLSLENPHTHQGSLVRSTADVHKFCSDIHDAPQEVFVVLCLNVRHRLIIRRNVAVGTLTGVEVHPREVFRPAIADGAAAVVLVHNHPSGDATPSRQDIELTERLRKVGELCGIAVLDHVVIAGVSFISFADCNWFGVPLPQAPF